MTRSLAARLQVTHLLTRYSERPIWALFMFLNGFITIALLAAVAMVSRTPFVFPSLGPTAFLLFFTPLAPADSTPDSGNDLVIGNNFSNNFNGGSGGNDVIVGLGGSATNDGGAGIGQAARCGGETLGR